MSMSFFEEIFSEAVNEDKRDETDLQKHELSVQFLASLPSTLLHEFIMILQNILTINIISGMDIHLQLLIATI